MVENSKRKTSPLAQTTVKTRLDPHSRMSWMAGLAGGGVPRAVQVAGTERLHSAERVAGVVVVGQGGRWVL